jgi:hypothetical protein
MSLDDLFGWNRLTIAGTAMPKRSTLDFVGATMVDDAVLERKDVTFSAPSCVVSSGSVTMNGTAGVAITGSGWVAGDVFVFTATTLPRAIPDYRPYVLSSGGIGSPIILTAYGASVDNNVYTWKLIR